MFPRSAGADGEHGTFRDLESRLDYVAGMGFDVLYLPPIHPIGTTHRKGKNNARTALPGDVGSPWAIGSPEGGHKSVHPELGTLEDFRRLVRTAREKGLEIALDVAFQCSPDHPYVAEHPDWFRTRPDGTIQFAENPPKKYEDIVPFDFDTADRRALWDELASVFEHWIAQGVEIFRVDNPHTKPFRFWEWLIDRIHAEHPEVIFLSEAFTRPKVLYRLAKLGFTQSYNYFPWRNHKGELVEYFTELTRSEVVEYCRPSLWPNTPDILTERLQGGGRPAFAQRLVLAATLGASYGIYGPAFELQESAPREPGSEEYLDSEKYQLRSWDLERPDSLRDLIARVNRIRRENPALQQNRTLVFHGVDNDRMLCYSKSAEEHSNVVLVVVNLDPHHRQSGWTSLDLEALGLGEEAREDRPFQVHDLITDARYLWQGGRNYVELDPHAVPAHVFRIRRRVRREEDFDYFV
jgi:starch synthase (maltosyl-transferring)